MAWGPCKQCSWWQIEPEAKPDDATMGLCTENELQPFRLRVSSNCGCNEHVAGKPGRAKGASQMPPMAMSQR